MVGSTQDLTHADAVAAFKALAKGAGPNAEASISLNASSWSAGPPLHGALYPHGLGKDAAIRVDAETYADLLAALKAKWAEHADAAFAQTIRDMALKIISITADEGSCSEFTLCKAFSPADVKAYGLRACDEATRIAGNGPFSIVCAASTSEAA